MAAVDASKEIRRMVDTGKAVFGKKQSEKSILKGRGQLVVLSSNVPELLREKIAAQAAVSGIPKYEFGGTASELGSVCGKPFVVGVMVVEDAGKSRVLDVVKNPAKR